MSLFDWLVIGHLVGDFLLQTDNMARYKPQQWPWMLRHIACYMIGMCLIIALFSWQRSVPLWAALVAVVFIVVTHIILDRRACTARWMQLVGMSPEQTWLLIVVDQVLHLVTLAIVAQGLAWAAG